MYRSIFIIVLFLLVLGARGQQCSISIYSSLDTLDCGNSISLYAQGIPGNAPNIEVDFENGSTSSGWVISSGGGLYNNPSCSNTNISWQYLANDTGLRSVISEPLDFTCGGNVCFELFYYPQGGVCDGPDYQYEGVYFQTSVDSGVTWQTIQYFEPDPYYDTINWFNPLEEWRSYCFAIPNLTQNTLVRWAQPAVSGVNFDLWALDNIQIYNSCVGNSNYVYSWSNGLGTSQVAFDSVVSKFDTTYTVTFSDGIDSCIASISIVPIVTPIEASVSGFICNDIDSIHGQVTVTGANSYSWQSLGVPIDSLTFGCDTCDTSWVHPNVTTDYVVSSDLTGICHETDTVTVMVNTEFDASFQHSSPFCYTESFVTLSPNISGGVWRGTGITDSINGVFNPSQVGVGSHPISYNILGACANSDTIELNVVEPLDPSFSMPDYICNEADPIQLTPAIQGGNFSGTGVTSTGLFDPGTINYAFTTDITYSIDNGCVASNTQPLNVYDFMPTGYHLSSSNIFEICANENSFSLIDSVKTFLPVPHRFIFTGNVQDSLTGLVDPSKLDLGSSNNITLAATDTSGQCYSSSLLFFEIDVNEVDYLKLVNKNYLVTNVFNSLTLDAPVNFNNLSIENIALTPNRDTIEFYYDGVTIRFDPNSYGIGAWELKFTYTNAEGCTGISYDTLYIQEPLSLTDSKQSLAELFPNPFMEELSIRLGSNVKEVIVYNELGQIVWRNVISSGRYELSINSENWGIGVYTVLIRDNNGKLEIEKVVKFE